MQDRKIEISQNLSQINTNAFTNDRSWITQSKKSKDCDLRRSWLWPQLLFQWKTPDLFLIYRSQCYLKTLKNIRDNCGYFCIFSKFVPVKIDEEYRRKLSNGWLMIHTYLCVITNLKRDLQKNWFDNWMENVLANTFRWEYLFNGENAKLKENSSTNKRTPVSLGSARLQGPHGPQGKMTLLTWEMPILIWKSTKKIL